MMKTRFLLFVFLAIVCCAVHAQDSEKDEKMRNGTGSAGTLPSGSVGFHVKATTGRFGYIHVN